MAGLHLPDPDSDDMLWKVFLSCLARLHAELCKDADLTNDPCYSSLKRLFHSVF